MNNSNSKIVSKECKDQLESKPATDTQVNTIIEVVVEKLKVEETYDTKTSQASN